MRVIDVVVSNTCHQLATKTNQGPGSRVGGGGGLMLVVFDYLRVE